MPRALQVLRYPSAAEAELQLAREIVDLVRARARAGKRLVLGLATGRSPLGLYARIAELAQAERLSFAHVSGFNLDEFQGLGPQDPRSFASFMQRHFYARLDVPRAAQHIPSGELTGRELEAHCRAYEEHIRAAGGIDLQILGIGRNGHIGFNEPGSERSSRTRLVELERSTREDALALFGAPELVPRQAVTMGVATILEARALRVLAFGRSKCELVRRTLADAPSAAFPASFLQGHADARLLVDPGADPRGAATA